MQSCNQGHCMYIRLFWMLRAACCGVQDMGFFCKHQWQERCIQDLSVLSNQQNILLCLCSHHCPSKMAQVSALTSVSGVKLSGINRDPSWWRTIAGTREREECTCREKWAGVSVAHTGAARAEPPRLTMRANNSRRQRVGQTGELQFQSIWVSSGGSRGFTLGQF